MIFLALALSVSVIGVALDEPFAIPECDKRPPEPYLPSPGYVTDPSHLCYEYEPTKREGESEEEYLVHFPTKARPEIMSELIAGVYVADGKVSKVEFDTLGVTDQNTVLDQLTTKFGKPTTVTRPVVKNLSGAAFQSVHAVWDNPTIYVDFDSAVSMDHGKVSVSTSAAKKARDARERDRNSARIPL